MTPLSVPVRLPIALIHAINEDSRQLQSDEASPNGRTRCRCCETSPPRSTSAGHALKGDGGAILRTLRGFVADGVRYFGVSLVALGIDYGLLIALHRGIGLNYLAAAALSFTAGLGVTWSLSVVFVFRGRRRLSFWREGRGFLLTGIAGLLLTQAAMACLVPGGGLTPEVAKVPIAGLVFLFNFVSRRALLFAPEGARPADVVSGSTARAGANA